MTISRSLAMADGVPFLNHDTIAEVLSYLPQSDCASFMRTCRFFNHEAIRFISKDGIILNTENKVASFTHFIDAEDRSRCLFVRELCIREGDLFYPGYYERALRQLSRSLHHLTSLISLEICHADVIFADCPSFARAVAQLTSLHHLTIRGVGHLSAFILGTFESKQLRSIRLRWHSDIAVADIQKEEYHPVELFSKWTSTLESLDCDRFRSLEGDTSIFAHIYPNMRKLSIDGDDWPLVAPYLRAYPNLARLDIKNSFWAKVKLSSENYSMRSVRQANVHSHSIGPRWQRLERVDAGLVDLYLWGLIYPISRVNIRTTIRTEPHLELLSEILSDFQPRELMIKGMAAQILHSDNSFMKMLHGHAGSRLESLVLRITLDPNAQEVDMATALEDLVGATLRACPLRHLRLCVDADTPRDPTPSPPRSSLHRTVTPSPPAPLTFAQRSLQEFDLAAFLRGLQDAIDSLEEVIIVIVGLGGGAQRVSYIPPRPGADPKEEKAHQWEL